MTDRPENVIEIRDFYQLVVEPEIVRRLDGVLRQFVALGATRA